MMLLIKLAIRNITHTGIRTWLNVIVLSVAFVAIILTEGIYEGGAQQVRDTEIDVNVGGGQFWNKNYDPLNPFSIDSSHSVIPDQLKDKIDAGDVVPVLIVQAAIFPRNIIQSVLIKGINPDQKVISLPTQFLKTQSDTNSIPGIIGSRMAKSTGLNEGDFVTARFKNINGTFDAVDIQIKKIFDINSPLADKDHIWVPLDDLQNRTQAYGKATILITNKRTKNISLNNPEWVFRDQDYLLQDINRNINRKRIYSTFIYILLLGLALIAIFDTQVLSIFKRRKEMGTLMALGMTKLNIIILFTIEGCITGLLSFLVGSVYGIPLLNYLSTNGIALPKMVQQSQFAIGLTLYPRYGIQLYLLTALILFISVIVVSFLPTRRIVKVKPTDALRGKLS